MKREFYSLSVTGFKSILLFLSLLLTGILSKAQTTTIEKTTVSGCYYYSGASKTTISVQVGWTGANSNDVIVVQLDGSLSRTINVEDMYDPGTGSAIAGPIKTPQVVAFEINADGLSHTITAQMSGTHFATATPVNFTAPSPCVPMQCNGTNLGGVVFNDNNADGQKQNGETVGIPGITIRAFDVNGAVYVATSDLNGAYAFSAANGNAIPTNAYPVRVEFTNFPNWAFSNSGPSTSTNSSSVQFVSAPSCSVNCGAVNPINYSQSNPKVISNIYTNNNPLVSGGSSGANMALISHDYTNNTDYNYTNLANASVVGSVWAKAWNKFKKKMFVSAFLKRHCGFGPLGIGGIYQVDMVNPNSPVVSNFIDVTTIGINVGQSAFPANNSGRGMSGNKLSPNADAAAFAGVGKYGIGGMDLSDDGNTLYFVNLFDKKVYSIDLTNYFASGTLPTSANVNTINISDPGCSNGSFRPFALKIREGKMYIGMVCDASSGTTSSLVAYVKSYDLTTQVWSDVFDFPLTYPKGYPDQADGTRTGWYVWSDDPAVVNPGNNQAVMHPVPMLSDIEFDMDGTMVLALMDRTSHQYGILNTDFWNGSSWQVSSVWLVAAGGDVLRAYYSNGAYVLENAAKAGPAVGYSTNNNQGPGFGEFYNDDINGGVYYHTEMGTGGLTLRPGSGEVMAGMVDPSFYQGGPLWANGVRRMSNSNGQSTGAMAYYSDSGISLFGKANGMGDMELVSDNVVYLELGNYAWNDVNNNGIQDPNESGVNGVVLKIYNASTGALIGSTTTTGNGNYYFSTLSGTSLLPNTTYNILVGEGQFNAGNQSLNIGGTLYNFSPANTGQGPDPDLNDNDFSPSTLSSALGAQPAGLPMFTITTGNAGYVNHTIDLGIRACVVDAGNNLSLSCNNPSGQIGTPGISGYTYSWLPTAGLSDPSIAQPIASPSVTTTYTLTVNGLCTDQVTVTVNGVFPTADAGIDKTLDCLTTSTTIGTTAIGGNTYSWSPSTGLNATNIAEPTASPTSTTTYTVTVTGSNGCTATDVVTVNVNTTPPTVDAGLDKDLDCTTTSTTIGTTSIGGNTYSWSPSTGLNATNVAEPMASPASTTTYTVTVTGSNGCTATDVVTVNVNTTPPTVDAGMDKDLDCTTTSTTIGTTAIGGNTYSWSPSTGLNATNIAEPTASPTSTTTYTVTVTGSNGCTSTDVVTVNVNTIPPTVDAVMDKDLDCTTTSTTIGTTAIVGNTYSWSPSTGLNATNIAEPTASPTSTTTYTVTVTGSNGCTATDVVTVNVNTTPPTVDAGMDKDLDCTTTSTTIGTTAIVGNTYSWSPSTGLNADNIAEPMASPSSTTTYTVTVTGSNGCTATDVVTVNVNTTPPAPVITGNLIVCNNGTTTLDASGGVSYVWTPGSSSSSSIVVGPGSYTVTATASNGCTATSVATVESVEGSVGNYVWYDSNGNGVFDESSSAGINNITVELWKESSPGSGIYALDQSTSTANNGLGDPGYYEFVICESANYKVRFPLSSGGFPLTTQTATAGTDANSDADRVSGESAVFAIDVNGTGIAKDNPTIDAGYYKPAQLGNYVWHDVDRDGIQDGNEVGVAGVTVTLYNSTNNTVVGATVTDAYGYYHFSPLSPGTYSVGFSTPANYVLTGSDQGSDDGLDSDADPSSGLSGNYTLVAGDSNMTVDAGIYVPSPQIACLGDRVWLDLNQNGIQDALEVGVAGVTVTLLNGSGQSIATTITNANGIYSFCNLVPGTYSVIFSRPIGYLLTSNDQGGNDEQDSDADPLTGQSSTVTLVAGDNNLSLDAGLYPQLPTNAGLGNYVWNDVNYNGVQDINETGVAAVTVTLYAADGTTVLNTTTTDELGYYIFNNLTPSTYVVGFSNLPSGFVFTTTDQGGNDATDSDPDSGTGLTAQIVLSAGEFDMSIDAGIHNASLPIGALGNYVWYDWNKNGVQDATENGVPGVTVTLYASDGSTVLNTTVTNLSGNYLFDNLAAGTYIVGFSNIPAGYAFTPADQGGNDATDSDPDLITYKTPATVLGTGEVNLTLDAGIIENAGRNNLGSLGDRVWYDDNQNGIQDVGENGVVGVTVSLYQADGITLINAKTTDALGNYIFTGLPAGSYVVGFSNIPGGYTFTTANQGSDDELDADADAGSSGKTGIVNLALGEENLSLDAGIYAAPGLASLGNYVWNDVNQDGLQDSGEPGVPGVSVTLYDNAGNVVSTTTTDANGLYQFTGLTPATYSVGFSNLPSGYEFTNSDQGGDDTRDSDADPVSGTTPTVTLIAGQNYPDFDAGIFTNLASLGNYVWNDLDQDGIQDALEEGIPGITVTLYASDGVTAISSAVTNASGYYSFVNLTPDTYVVGFSNIPENAFFSPSNVGSDDGLDSDADAITGRTGTVTLSAGEYNPTLDAGIYIPQGAGLGDYVWLDLNNDGQQDANEPGVPGVTAILNDGGGNPIKSTITDASGYYTFPNLAPGIYSVTFTTLPYQRLFALQNTGNDVSDNDVSSIVNLPNGYPQSGTTGNYTLAAGEYNPTIDAGISNAIPLGVSSIVAQATLREHLSTVRWVTRDEKNVHHFEIERSTDAATFTKVATHVAVGTTQGEQGYQIVDDVIDLMGEAIIYYRVKVVDIDGRSMYSNTVSVRPGSSEQISAYPSPFSSSVMLEYLSDTDSELEIVMTDLSGRKVYQSNQEVKEGMNRLTLEGLGALANGIYSIRVKDFYSNAEFVLRVQKH